MGLFYRLLGLVSALNAVLSALGQFLRSAHLDRAGGLGVAYVRRQPASASSCNNFSERFSPNFSAPTLTLRCLRFLLFKLLLSQAR